MNGAALRSKRRSGLFGRRVGRFRAPLCGMPAGPRTRRIPARRCILSAPVPALAPAPRSRRCLRPRPHRVRARARTHTRARAPTWKSAYRLSFGSFFRIPDLCMAVFAFFCLQFCNCGIMQYIEFFRRGFAELLHMFPLPQGNFFICEGCADASGTLSVCRSSFRV